jgi:hypothetical protein
MKLIQDEYNEVWVWVDDFNEDLELSPQFDDEPYALAWRGRILKELDNDLDKLYNGDNVVLPRSKEHAEAMLRVATFYLSQNNESKN